MATCPDPSQLEDLLAGRLSIEQYAALEGHILNCAECRQQFDTMREPDDGFLEEFTRAIDVVPGVPAFSDRLESIGSPDPAKSNSEMSRAHASGIVGDYRLIRKVGQGGMGVVFEAEEIRLRRRVALKTLSFAHLIDPGRLKRFHNEARAAATLDDHPHIVTVFNVGVDRGLHYYAMRFIDGHNLAEIFDKLCMLVDRPGTEGDDRNLAKNRVLKSGTTVPLGLHKELAPAGSTDLDPLFLGDESARQRKSQSRKPARPVELPAILADMEPLGPRYILAITKLGVTAAQALAHAHKHGVMHRDIKPSNLMLDVDGRLWVTDFGLARIETDPGSTLSGAWMGTVRYMSPEQLSESAGVVDHRSDIYALGVTLYEMLTLRPLFSGSSPQRLFESVAEGKIAPPRSLNPAIPIDLETVLLKAVAKDSIDRYATADAFADDLTRFLENKPVLAERPTVIDRVGKWLKRHPSAIVAGLCALALFFIVGMIQAKLYFDQRALLADLEKSQHEQAELHELSESHLYVADVGLAANAINERDTAAALNYLTRRPGAPDRRGFEWYWLYSKYENLSGPISVSPKALYRIELNPRGNLAAVAGADSTVYILDTQFWEVQSFLKTDQIEVNCMAFSSDAQLMATGGNDGTVCIWDLATGAELLRIKATAKEVWGVAFTFDGEELISCGNDDHVQFWSCESGLSTGWLPVNAKSVEDLRISPDGKVLVTSSGPNLFLWDLSPSTWTPEKKTDERPGSPRAFLQKVLAVRKDDGPVPSFCFFKDGSHLLSGSYNKEVHDWDLKTGESRIIGKHLDQVAAVAVSPDGKTAASGDRGGVVHTWNLEEPTEIPKPINPNVEPELIWVVSKDRPLRWCRLNSAAGNILAVTDQKLVSRSLASEEVKDIPLADPSILQTPRQNSPHIADLSADGKWLVVLNEIFTSDDPSSGNWKTHARIPHPASEIHAVEISPDGKKIAVGNHSGRVWLHETASGNQIGVLEEPVDNANQNQAAVFVTSLSFSEDGNCLAANSSANVPMLVNFWNLSTWERQQSSGGKTDPIQAIRFNARRKEFGTCAGDNRIRLWSSRNAEFRGEFLMVNPRRSGEILGMSPNGRILAVADRNADTGTIGLWSIREEREFAHLKLPASHLGFSFDSKKLLSGDDSGTIRLWNLEEIIEKAELEEETRRTTVSDRKARESWAAVRLAHTGRVYSMLFTHDGNRLASVGSDGKVLVAKRGVSEDIYKLTVPAGIEKFNGFDLADNGTMIAWEVSEGAWIFSPGQATKRLLSPADSRLVSVSLNAEGSRAVAAYRNGNVRILDVDTRTLLREIHVKLESGEGIEQVAFIPNSRLILVRVVGQVRKNRFYDVETGERVSGYPEASGASQAVARHRNRVAFAHDRGVYYFDVAPGNEPVKIDDLDTTIDQIAISDDGTRIAGGTTTRQVHVWDTEGRTPRINWLSHRNAVTAVGFSRDGRTLASGDDAGVVKLWDLQTERQFYDLTNQLDAVWQIQFSTDGKKIFCQSPQDGEISVFSAAPSADRSR